MFVRVKAKSNSPKKVVQIVASVRRGSAVSQKVIRHIGTAIDEEGLNQLKLLAEETKLKLSAGSQQLLWTPKELARLTKPKEPTDEEVYRVDVRDLIEEGRVVKGIGDVYGRLFDEMGYERVFKNPARQKATLEAFKQIVLARIANPLSKRASVDMLEEDFGVSLPLERVYRMMDKLDTRAIEQLNAITYRNTVGLFGGKIDILFFDVTTIYFEAFGEDDFRRMGYSKDLKFNQPQVLLALLVNKEGLPIGYETFAGDFYEGHTLMPTLERIRSRYEIDKVICVADAGMLNEKNIKELEAGGFQYIVGARLKNMSQAVKEHMLDRHQYQKWGEQEIAQFDLTESKRLVVTYQEDRARKDAFDRQRAIERLKKKLQKSNNPKEYLSHYGCGKYLKLTNPGEIELDEEKIQKQSQWDGLHGVITNAKELKPQEIVRQYVNLWHVEEAFRITKHDLKVRPVFHWTKERIQAHVAICFTAYALVRHLQYRVRLQYQNLSIETIRQHLIRVQTSILYHLKKKIRFALPSRISQEAKRIYQIMKVSHSLTPWLIRQKL